MDDERDDERDDDAALAELIGVPLGALHRALGARWTEVGPTAAHGFDRWFVSGRPAQVGVGTDGFGFVLGRPDPYWQDHRLAWRFVEARRFWDAEVLHEPDVLAQLAEEVARRRRRTFRWCPMCREVHPPEFVADNTGLCQRCAEQHSRVVF
jgi:hypothetical protein